jgi:hypothetical protein
MKVVSRPEDLFAGLCDPAWRLERVGLEAGPLSQWLFKVGIGGVVGFEQRIHDLVERVPELADIMEPLLAA